MSNSNYFNASEYILRQAQALYLLDELKLIYQEISGLETNLQTHFCLTRDS